MCVCIKERYGYPYVCIYGQHSTAGAVTKKRKITANECTIGKPPKVRERGRDGKGRDRRSQNEDTTREKAQTADEMAAPVLIRGRGIVSLVR